jgi:hypothetical protein
LTARGRAIRGDTLKGVTVSWLLLLAACGGASRHDANETAATGGAENASGTGGRDDASGSAAANGGLGGSDALSGGRGGGTLGDTDTTGGASGNRAPVACENPRQNPYGGGFLICDRGLITRPSASQCKSPWPRTEAADPLIGDDCVHDADCLAEPYGTCAYGECVYGNCLSDDDCGHDQACFCRESIGVCAPALCRTDADCEPGYPCTSANQGLLGAQLFACQRPDAECLFNTDCVVRNACMVQLTNDGTFAVGARACVPIPG